MIENEIKNGEEEFKRLYKGKELFPVEQQE